MKRRMPSKRDQPLDERETVGLRIVGGKLRGRPLAFSGDARTRPMKDRLREAVFNLLGPAVVGTHAIDLFAGTGALGLEAISRGATRATLIERHLPTTKLIEGSAAALGIADQVHVQFADAFKWKPQAPEFTEKPWVVFCSPPYEFYVARKDDMLKLIERLYALSPAGSQFVVEADERFDFQTLPEAERWDVRKYPPAVVGVVRQPWAL
jgi:16S rRNA (guanine(966)-N(2))-methyltransferase RsmD